ncbi:hypothetical protein D4L85_27665 [Chryseolinea soli]|uniref:Uncharacterized protein n=1 Tax=Chryseolinea soli TaxID=2321403 RepID=A0A385SUA4_9BACT|nr:hypothetical protein D4L85_27665 [Chryseolinea soli]
MVTALLQTFGILPDPVLGRFKSKIAEKMLAFAYPCTEVRLAILNRRAGSKNTKPGSDKRRPLV